MNLPKEGIELAPGHHFCPDRRFNQYLAELVCRLNALFWLAVWLTAKDQGLWNGVTKGGVSLSDLDFIEAVGRRARAFVCGPRTLVDGFIKKELISLR